MAREERGVDPTAGVDEELNLKQVAARLGVHYMTAYRYVRSGRLPATKVGQGWVVAGADLAAFGAPPSPGDRAADGPVDWSARLTELLLAGDEVQSWRLLEQALVSGVSVTDCYVTLLAGSLAAIDSEPDGAPSSVAVAGGDASGPFLATATAKRLVARLGGRFRRPGRSRGTVVFGAPEGERHDLPIAIVADLVRIDGFTCLELGADVPAAAFAAAVERADGLVAVGMGVTQACNLDAARTTIEAVRGVDEAVPVVVGGQGVRNAEIATLLGATAWAPDGAGAVAVIRALVESAPAARRRSLVGRPDAARPS